MISQNNLDILHGTRTIRFREMFSARIRSILLFFLFAFLWTHGSASNAGANGAKKQSVGAVQDTGTHIYMRNVIFWVMPNVAVHVAGLTGMIAPTSPNGTVSLDDQGSFSLEMQNARTSISSRDLTVLVNNYILPKAITPIRNLSMTLTHDQTISVKGTFRKLIDVPFTADANVQATPDGNMRMHLSNLRVAGVIHQDILDFLGLKVSNLAQPKRQQTFQIVGNDLIFPISQMFPPPHMEGKLQSVNIADNRLNLVFGTEQGQNPKLPVSAENYIYFKGGRMQFGRLTMTPVEMELVNLKAANSFEFALADYYKQLAAGYSKSLPDGGLLVHMANDHAVQPKAAQSSR